MLLSLLLVSALVSSRYLKGLKDYDGSNQSRRWLGWVLRRSDPVACVLLSVKFDPFIVTAYLRHGRFGGMAARDWRIFLP